MRERYRSDLCKSCQSVSSAAPAFETAGNLSSCKGLTGRRNLRFRLAVDIAKWQRQLFGHNFRLHLAPSLAHLFLLRLTQLAHCWDVTLGDLVVVLYVILQLLTVRPVLVLDLQLLQLFIQILLLLILLVGVEFAFRLLHLVV